MNVLQLLKRRAFVAGWLDSYARRICILRFGKVCVFGGGCPLQHIIGIGAFLLFGESGLKMAGAFFGGYLSSALGRLLFDQRQRILI